MMTDRTNAALVLQTIGRRPVAMKRKSLSSHYQNVALRMNCWLTATERASVLSPDEAIRPRFPHFCLKAAFRRRFLTHQHRPNLQTGI